MDPRLDQLREAFGTELRERVPELNRLLLVVERDDIDDAARREALDALFREAHSLKGAARAVQLPVIEQLAHAMETGLQAERQAGRDRVCSPAWFDAAYRAVDAIADAYAAAIGDAGAGPPIAAIIEELSASVGRSPERPALVAAPPPQCQDAAGGTNNGASLPAAPTAEPYSTPAGAHTKRPASRPAVESVRVAVDKLDALLAQAGELGVTHVGIEQGLRELHALRQSVAVWQREWRGHRVAHRSPPIRHSTAPVGRAQAQHVDRADGPVHHRDVLATHPCWMTSRGTFEAFCVALRIWTRACDTTSPGWSW